MRLLTIALVIGATSASDAQLRKGRVEAGALLGFGAAVDHDDARYLLLRTLGFSLSDAWQVGVQLGLAGDFTAAPSSTVLAAAQYHWAPAAALTPYIGAHAGLEADVLTDDPRVQDVVGPQLGAKWLCGEKLLLIAELRYSLQVSQPDRGVALLSLGFGLIETPNEPPAP